MEVPEQNFGEPASKTIVTPRTPSSGLSSGSPSQRNGAAPTGLGLRRVGWGLAVGLLLCLGAAFFIIWSLDMRVTSRALSQHGAMVEDDLVGMIRRVGAEEFAEGGGGLATFEGRLAEAATQTVFVLDLRVFPPGPPPSHPCLRNRLLQGRTNHEHPANEIHPSPVGCVVVPVRHAGRLKATVLLHLRREWAEGGELLQAAVRATTLQLAPVFVCFYLLLGGLLYVAIRAASRWRAKAMQAERIEALGALSSGISHEIKNPLNALGLCLQVLERRHDDADSRETLEVARTQSHTINEILDEFGQFARVQSLDLSEQSIASLIDRGKNRGDRSIDLFGDATARVDATKMKGAMRAIVDLLERAAPEGRRVDIRLGAGSAQWRIKAQADALELDASAFDHLFDPYVRSRPRDVGRGLAWARAVFQAHGGDLEATRRGDRLVISGHAAVKPGV
ncbi:MAG: histidine kinase dimerization/phospho-acceptor domain-containing protein [Planctomycetota bacterium]